MNHIHLLPSYDFGSVPERPEEQAHVQVGSWVVVGSWTASASDRQTHSVWRSAIEPFAPT